MESGIAELRAAELTQEEIAAKRKRAFELFEVIKAGLVDSHRAWWRFAPALWELHEEELWLWLEYETLNEFLAQPEIGMSRSEFFRQVQIYEQLVVQRKVAPARLEELEPSKVKEVLPAITRGDVGVDEALADAKEMGKRDLREQYAKEAPGGSGVDEDDPIVMVQCPNCSSWVDRDRLRDAEEPVDSTAEEM